MRHCAILILLLFYIVFPASGQGNSGGSGSDGVLYLNFRNTNFIRNNEYSNPIVEGYTLIGYFIQPELVYRPAEKTELRLGAHLLSYSGTNKFSLVKPVFSTSWHFSENTRFTIGSLSGSDDHSMSDPHFNRERIYNAFSEDGLQLVTSNDHIFSDTWLSWENYIFKGDSGREIFTAGESFRYTSREISGRITLEIPVQAQVKHFGGQISDYPEQVETYLNIAAGARVSLAVDQSESASTGVESLFFMGKCLSDNAPSGIRHGFAGWYKLFFSCRKAELEAGYWSSHDYYAPDGNFIFGSVSDRFDNLVITDRKLITGSINIRLPYSDFFEFYFGFDSYYDTDLRRFDNAMTLHIKLDKLIKIAAISK
jgi:hypothetical protein